MYTTDSAIIAAYLHTIVAKNRFKTSGEKVRGGWGWRGALNYYHFNFAIPVAIGENAGFSVSIFSVVLFQTYNNLLFADFLNYCLTSSYKALIERYTTGQRIFLYFKNLCA